MKWLRVVLTLPDEYLHPMHAFVCRSPDVEREVLLEGKADDGTETLLAYVEGDRDAYEAELDARPEVVEHHVTADGDDGFYLYLRGTLGDAGVELMAALDRDSLVLVPPIEFRSDRTMHLSLVGHPDDLQAALDALPDAIDVDVRRVGAYADALSDRLTDRQREALDAAWTAGYYAVPRDTDLTAVADELDCAVSTASDLLRRAEARLVADALGKRA